LNRPTSSVEKGQRFGRLIVMEPLLLGRCRVICDCDVVKEVGAKDLKNGKIRSCGCLLRERTIARNTTHGRSRTPEHQAYFSMLNRCTNPKYIYWRRYGGRGITVCDRWLGSGGFERFYEDMGPRPEGLTLERKKNDGSYTPDNCIWATRKTQMRNMRRNRRLTARGRTMTAVEWAEELGVRPMLIIERLRHGWSVERSVSEPVKKG
jgi:hypothetical protein